MPDSRNTMDWSHLPPDMDCVLPLTYHKRRRLNSSRPSRDMSSHETYDGLSYQTVERLPLSDAGSEYTAYASARASLEPRVTPNNIRFLRTYHPALSGVQSVSIALQPSGLQFWVAWLIYDLPDTHAAGLEIHIMPHLQRPSTRHLMVGYRPDALSRCLNPRKLLSRQDLASIKQMFPLACGIQIWIAGRLTVLFPDKFAMQRDSDTHNGVFPDTVGGLAVGCDVLSLTPSTQDIRSGTAVCPQNGLGVCAIGLRLRLPDHHEPVITTVTHGFVKLPGKWIVTRVASLLTTMLRFLKGNRRQQLLPPVVHSDQSGNSSVGKRVLSALTKQPIGRVTSSYDKPNHWLPYPAGYKHDLSLISAEPGQCLPEVRPAPGMPPITGWGDIEEVLAGTHRVFMTSLRMKPSQPTGEWKTYEGLTDVDQVLRRSQVEAMQYIWDMDPFEEPKTAILWRNIKGPQDLLSAGGFSGTVLCQGQPTDKEVKALVFQNFQWEVTPGPYNADDWAHTFIKGGYLLPDEVRQSSIECVDPEAESRPSGTWPRNHQSSTDTQRRYASDPTA